MIPQAISRPDFAQDHESRPRSDRGPVVLCDFFFQFCDFGNYRTIVHFFKFGWEILPIQPTTQARECPIIPKNAYRNIYVLSKVREGPCSQGASWAVCGSRVPPYQFLDLHGIFNSRFLRGMAKNGSISCAFMGSSKAEELGDQVPELLSLRRPPMSL